MPWPSFLFKNSQNETQTAPSTMAGGFSSRNLLRGENPFAAQIPSVQSSEPVKKRVIITDFSLGFEQAHHLIRILESIDTLMKAGFEVFIVCELEENYTELTRLTPQADEGTLLDDISWMIPVTEENVRNYDKEYTADGTVLLDYQKMRSLVEVLTNRVCSFPPTLSINSVYRRIDIFQRLIIPYYKQFKRTLRGHALPEIILDGFVLNRLQYEIKRILSSDPDDKEIGTILHWGFRFIILDIQTLARCLNSPGFPKDKIVGLQISSEDAWVKFKELNQSLPSVEKLWIATALQEKYQAEIRVAFPNFNPNKNANESPDLVEDDEFAKVDGSMRINPSDFEARKSSLFYDNNILMIDIMSPTLGNELVKISKDESPGDECLLEDTCAAIYFRGNIPSLIEYLRVSRKDALRSVHLWIGENPFIPDGVWGTRVTHLSIAVASNYDLSQEQIWKILSKFPYIQSLIFTGDRKKCIQLYHWSFMHYKRMKGDAYVYHLATLEHICRAISGYCEDHKVREHQESRMIRALAYPNQDQNMQNNIIYDSLAPNGLNLPMSQNSATQTFQMVPVCEVLVGGKKYDRIRRRKFTYDFSKWPLVKQYLKPTFAVDLKLANASQKPTHKMHAVAKFEWDEGEQYYCYPLPGMTKNDLLCSWKFPAGSGPFEIKFSTSDEFYYLVSKNRPQDNFEFDYFLHDPDKLDNSLYENLAVPYWKDFKKEDRNNPIFSMKDVQDNPEYYNCAQRTAAFLNQHSQHQACFYGVESGTHEWVEHKTGILELGGRPSNLVYVTPPAPIAPVNPDFIPFQEPKILTRFRELDELLSRKSANTLLLFDTQQELEHLRAVIIRIKREEIIVIDKPSDLKTSVPYLSIGGDSTKMGALPGGWIANQLKNSWNSTLLIDWSSFVGRELPQNNTCIGKVSNRKIGNFPLDSKLHVIGLALKNSAAARDRSHVSRHRGSVFQVASSALPTWRVFQKTHEQILQVDLYGSPQWYDKLVASIEIENGRFVTRNGELLQNACTKLIIKNPPKIPLKDRHEFDRLVTHLKHGTYFQCFDHSIRIKEPLEVEVHEGYDFSAYAGLIASIYTNVVDAVMHHYEIHQVINPSTFDRLFHDSYIDKNSILQKSEGWLDQEHHHFYLTRTLPPHQLCAFLDKLAQMPAPRKNITLVCAPGVTLPEGLTGAIFPHDYNQYLPITEAKYCKQVDLTVNVTGRSPDDLLYGNKAKVDSDRFLFTEEVSDLWHALQNGKHLCLTGVFSESLIDHLSTLLLPVPYLWYQHKKVYFPGKLTLCPDKPMPSLTWLTRSGMIAERIIPADNPLSIVLTPEDDRKQAVQHVLKDSPTVLIQGAPGIGKSSFIHALKKDPEVTVYSENRLIDWAKDSEYKGKDAVLVIDESTIRNSDWTVFEGLYCIPPHLLIGNKIYYLQKHQKVIFLGNQTPKMPSLFRRLPKITFVAPSRDYILDNILRPILKDRAEAFINQRSRHTVRELHAEAIALAAREKPKHSRFSDTFGAFTLTPSRLPIVQTIISCLNARNYRIEAEHDAAKFGGQTGLWIEGPAGIGKTELIRATLQALGYKEELDYIVLPANMDPEPMIKMIGCAFDLGLIVVIDELDTALTDEMTAQINAYLMGEDLNFERPRRAGFTLFATGNGPCFAGRIPLPESLKSRLICQPLAQYPEAEARQLLMKHYLNRPGQPSDFASTIEGHLQYHLAYPLQFSFREVCDWLEEGGNPSLPKRAPKGNNPLPHAPATHSIHRNSVQPGSTASNQTAPVSQTQYAI